MKYIHSKRTVIAVGGLRRYVDVVAACDGQNLGKAGAEVASMWKSLGHKRDLMSGDLSVTPGKRKIRPASPINQVGSRI